MNYQLWHFWLLAKGQRWLAVFPVSSPSHTHTHTLTLLQAPDCSCSQEDPSRQSHAVCQRALISIWETGAVDLKRTEEEIQKTHWPHFNNECTLDEQINFPAYSRSATHSTCLWINSFVLPVTATFKDCFTAWEGSDEELVACSKHTAEKNTQRLFTAIERGRGSGFKVELLERQ